MRFTAENTLSSSAAATDQELLRRVAARDRGALEQLYVAYHRRLSRFLMRFTRRYDVAEEIINDTLFVVWQKAEEFRGDSQVSTWIIGIAYRRALKALSHLHVVERAEAAACEAEQDDEVGGAGLHDQDGVRNDWLAQGLSRLPLEQRMTLELAYFLGHSCEEIGQITGCPVNTVKTRMYNARQRLREILPQLAEPTAAPSQRSQ